MILSILLKKMNLEKKEKIHINKEIRESLTTEILRSTLKMKETLSKAALRKAKRRRSRMRK
jgi:hypothetical protein